MQAQPLILGPNWKQNDLRVLFVSGSESASGGVAEAIEMNPDPPTGFTSAYSLNAGFETRGVYYRRLVSGDVDQSVAWIKPTGWVDFVWAPLTIRGVSPTVAPVAGDITFQMSHKKQDTSISITSITVPAAGEMLLCLWTIPDPEGIWPSWATTLGVPSGWTHVAATDKSGNVYNSANADVDPSILIVGKSFAAAGSTGTITVPCNPGSHAFGGMYLFVQPAADSASVAGAIAAAAAAGAATSSSSTNPSSKGGPLAATATIGQAFNGTSGLGLSPVMTLSGLPVTASVVEWTSNGLPFKVETTINGGASWDTVASSGDPVPRLNPNDTATRTVQLRISASRATVGSTSPKLTSLRLAVTDDESTIELVPVGHGAVDKVTRKRTTTSSGSSGGSGGPGVAGKGGGQAGGGRSLTVHAVDLSKLVSANPWGSAFVIQTGENYVDAAVRFLLNRLPSQTRFRVCASTKTTPEPFIYGLNQGTDPWKDLKEFLLPAGLECFFDAAGVFVIRQIPDPSVGVPVWTIDDDAHPVITDLSDELTSEQVFNDITVKSGGTSTKNPVSARAFDDNPQSDTYILGDFGTHSVTITLPGIETADQAQTAADAILAGSLSGSQVITVSMVPNPALEPGDLVRLDLEDQDMSGVFLVNGMTWSPSQAEPMQLILARQTAAA